ncbi:MAG TPA: DUF5658 family protein [Pyrinomonadaceae bacterium]|jgi:hypothetical protein|nr:DUF5658 family protein [Pyrinomonadaceae bacterium]
MPLLNQIILLFGLNLLDALLTVVWVRSGVATESNKLMAELLDIGNFPFLFVKILIGAVTALVLFRYANRPITRYCLTIALVVYGGLMGVHLLTGMSAFGVLPDNVIQGLAFASGHALAVVLP